MSTVEKFFLCHG